MPFYDSGAGHKVLSLVQGVPSYLLGSWPMDAAPTRFLITQVSLTTNVATITGSVIEGDIPAVGSLISIRGTQASGGVFNVSGVAIASVTINASTGIGTITFPLTNANIGNTADAGIAVIPKPEVGDTLANGASIPCTMPVQDPKTDSARTLSAMIGFPTLPTAAVVDLQWAIYDQPSEYEKIGNVATVSAGAITAGPGQQFTLTQARFYRLNISGLTGAGTIVGKVLV